MGKYNSIQRFCEICKNNTQNKKDIKEGRGESFETYT